MKRNRRVKVLATLGPASSKPTQIKKLFNAGADVFRINMSHSSHEDLDRLYGIIREIEDDVGRPIGILADLQGPKLRIGDFAEKKKIKLKKGSTFILDANPEPGNSERIHLPHPEIFECVENGHRLILDDGKIHLQITNCDKQQITSEVVVGGKLASRKGVSVPDSVLPFSAMTDKDRNDLEKAASTGVDWIALSFVQRTEDVAEAIKLARGRSAIMAKLEKPSAIEQLDQIVEMADGIMVARGDLGVEMPVEKVPSLQKRIKRQARALGKPVVIATQMLESMIESPVPTRAEVSDVATAVYEGVDAVMLSAESAVGYYPCEAIEVMDKIAREVENDDFYGAIVNSQRPAPDPTAADAISAAARTISDTLNLQAIMCYTSSGSTGMRASRERPRQPIIALSPVKETGRRLTMSWGIHSVLTSDPVDLDDMVAKACRIAYAEKFAEPGQRVIVTAGVPLGKPGATNMLRVAFVGDDGNPL
jgi:pyruvate kinase